MAGGGASQPQSVTTNTSNLPAYAQPYYENLMQRAQALSNQQYTPYQDQRIAGFTPDQTQVQQDTMGLQSPTQYTDASNLAGAAGLGALQAGQYTPSNIQAQQVGLPSLTNYQMNPVADVNASGMQQTAPQMDTAQTGYNPGLNYFQMNAPQTFGAAQAAQYMSPYMQDVVDVQKQQALRDAQKDQLVQNMDAVRQGTYGGARQLLAGTERERNLGDLMNNIQATGSQNAYTNAQQQFNTDQNAAINVGGQNLNAALGVQQLGVNTGLQTSLANLSSDQQARVQNLAAQLQTQGLNANQAMQAALANQQSALTTGQQNLNAQLQTQQLGTQSGLQALLGNQQSNLAAQQANEQSNQFGANLGLQGLAQANQSAQTLGNLGQLQQQGDISRLTAQSAVGQQQQTLNQQQLDQQYQDFLNQLNYPQQQLSYYSDLMHGVPISSSTTSSTSVAPPSLASQVGGLGLGALGLYNLAK